MNKLMSDVKEKESLSEATANKIVLGDIKVIDVADYVNKTYSKLHHIDKLDIVERAVHLAEELKTHPLYEIMTKKTSKKEPTVKRPFRQMSLSIETVDKIFNDLAADCKSEK